MPPGIFANKPPSDAEFVALSMPGFAKRREYVVHRFDERRAVLDEAVAAAREGIMYGTGNRHDFASLFAGEARGDERA